MRPPTPSLDPDAYRLMRAGRLREALPLAERAVAGARTCLPGHGMLTTILLQLGRVHDAEGVVTLAMSLVSGTAEAYDGLAYVSMILGRHERANALYRRATELAPDVPRYWYNLACSERSLGRLAAAEAACDRCIALDSFQHPTFILRSELRVQTREANHIAELQRLLADAYPFTYDFAELARYYAAYAGPRRPRCLDQGPCPAREDRHCGRPRESCP